MSVPTTDTKLAEYSTNFQARGSLAPTDFALSAGQMVQYTTLHDAFISANNACKAEGARSKALVVAKNDAKAALIPFARELYAIVKNAPNVSNENKTLIGIHISDNVPTPQPAPALSPLLVLLSIIGSVGRYKLSDRAEPNTRRRPLNAKGATILSYVGTTPPPADDPRWKLEGQTGRNVFEIDFGNVEPGTPCWAIALWYNARGEYSPACPAVQAYPAVGPVAEAS